MISLQEIENLISLARLELSADEKEKLRADIESILDYVGQIKQAASDNSLTISHELINVLRDDTEAYSGGEYTEALLAAAPDREDDYLRVKKILS